MKLIKYEKNYAEAIAASLTAIALMFVILIIQNDIFSLLFN